MVNTIKITVTLSPYEPWFADVLTGAMAELGFDTFVENEEALMLIFLKTNTGKKNSKLSSIPMKPIT